MAIPETIPFIGIRWEDVLFMLFATVMLGAALLVVVLRDIIRCALAMMVSFGALAGIFVLLGSPIVAAAQVLVYIGAISVLVLFAIMLTQTKAAPARLVFQTQAWAAAIGSVILALLVALAVGTTDWGAPARRAVSETDAVARTLFADYALAFEVVGVLLLAAVIGGVFLAKREAPGDGPGA